MKTTKNKNPYDVLGVLKTATKSEIKSAFRKLAREFHPDSDPNNPWIEDRFKEVSAAYEKLAKVGVSAKRRAGPKQDSRTAPKSDVDPTAAKPKADPSKNASDSASSDVFEEFKRRRKNPRVKVRGADVSYALKVGFYEAVKGCNKTITVTNGKHLQVKVPAGTLDGDVLRLKGQGLPGLGGKDAGDAKVEILVDPHPDLRVEGRDVHINLPITLHEAVLGGRIHVQTLTGKVAATVPPGSNTGTALRLKGLGITRDGQRGDQFVTLQVVLPKAQDDSLKDFVKNWSPKGPYRVRED